MNRRGPIVGTVMPIGPRTARFILQNLHPRVREREPDDEIDADLAGLAAVALARPGPRQVDDEPLPPQPLTTADVAAMHRVHEASVRRAILAGRLPATRGRHGWEVAPADAHAWRPRKARPANRAA